MMEPCRRRARCAFRVLQLLLLVAALFDGVISANAAAVAAGATSAQPSPAASGPSPSPSSRLHSLLQSTPYAHAAVESAQPKSMRSARGGQTATGAAALSRASQSPSLHPHDVLLRAGALRVDRDLQRAHAASMHAARHTNLERNIRRERAQSARNGQERTATGPRVHNVTLDSGAAVRLHLPTVHHYRTTTTRTRSTLMGANDALLPRQWLLHLKPPITPSVIAALNALLAPFALGAYLPHNSFLLCAPEEVALRLKEMTTENAAPLEGRLLLLAELPAVAKVQPALGFVAQAHHDERVRVALEALDASSANSEHRHSQVLDIPVELRVHLLFPSARASQAGSGPDSDALARMLASFPADRQDTRYMQRLLAELEGKAAQPETQAEEDFAAPVTSLSFRRGAPVFVLVDSTQFLVRLPRSPPNGTDATARARFDESYAAALDEWVSRLLVAAPLVHFVESHTAPLVRLLNRHARATLQTDGLPSFDASITASGDDSDGNDPSTPLYHIGALGLLHPGSYAAASEYPRSPANADATTASSAATAGLRGQGQLVTIGDSGIDHDSCFFHDPSEAVPVNTASALHRKVHAYITVPVISGGVEGKADPGDLDGHGTHTAGSLAGSALSKTDPAESVSRLSRHDGVASRARLVVFDFSTKQGQPGSLSLPSDLYGGYLARSYAYGSRISSNSWGSPSVTPSTGFGAGRGTVAGVYDSSALALDLFVADHPDYLVVMAAGNSGAYGLGSIATPAVAKNVLTVGSHRSTFGVNGNNLAVRVEAPADFASRFGLSGGDSSSPADFLVSAASFGQPFGQMSLQSRRVCMSSPPEACTPLTLPSACQGGVILVQSGTCPNALKLRNIDLFGGELMAVVAEAGSVPAPMSYALDSGVENKFAAAAVMVSATFGQALAAYLAQYQDDQTLPILTLSYPHGYNGGSYHTGRLSLFSSHGPTADGRLKPDVLAPGDSVLSATTTGRLDDFQCASTAGGSTSGSNDAFNEFPQSLAVKDGTSMATPLAAGAAALVRQYLQEGWLLDPATGLRRTDLTAPSAALLKAVLIQSGQALAAQDVEMVDHTKPSWNARASVPLDGPPSFLQGFGRLQLDRVLSFPGSAYPTGLFVDDASSVGQGGVLHYCFAVSPLAAGSRAFKATLVWTDPAPSLTSALALVNNLDLIVIRAPAAGGEPAVYIGNAGGATSSTSASSQSEPLQWDMLNNVEQVTIPSSEAGAGMYSVLVRGTSVPGPSGLQKFALVVNGAFTLPSASSSTGCSMEVFCPNGCSGHGLCAVDSAAGAGTPGETAFDANAPPSAANGNTGFCACDPGWFGADCGHQGLELDPWNTVSLPLFSGGWAYLCYAYDPLWDESLILSVTVLLADATTGALVSSSDPDLYVLLPGSTAHSPGGLTYPTLTHYTRADLAPPVLAGDVAVHSMVFSAADLAAVPRGQVVVGLYGYCCGQSSVQVRMESVRKPGAPGPPSSESSSTAGGPDPVAPASSSTGAGGGALAPSSSSTGGASAPPSFNISYVSYSFTLRLRLAWPGGEADVATFKRQLQAQLQRGLNLTSYDSNDQAASRRNRVWVQSAQDDPRTEGSNSTAGGSSAAAEVPSNKRFRTLAAAASPGILATLSLLPSAKDTPSGGTASALPDLLSPSSSDSPTPADLMLIDALLFRLLSMLNSNASAPAETLSPSAAFLDGGPLLVAIDVAQPLALRTLTISYCSASSVSSSTAASWTEGVCPQAAVVPPDGTPSSTAVGRDGSADSDSDSSSAFAPLTLTYVIIIAAGGGVVLLSLLVASIWLWRRRRAAGAKQAPSPMPPAVVAQEAAKQQQASATVSVPNEPVHAAPVEEQPVAVDAPNGLEEPHQPVEYVFADEDDHDEQNGAAVAPAVELAQIVPAMVQPLQRSVSQQQQQQQFPAQQVRIHLSQSPEAAAPQSERAMPRIHAPTAQRPSHSPRAMSQDASSFAQSPPSRRAPSSAAASGARATPPALLERQGSSIAVDPDSEQQARMQMRNARNAHALSVAVLPALNGAGVPSPHSNHSRDPSILAPIRQRPIHRSYHSDQFLSLDGSGGAGGGGGSGSAGGSMLADDGSLSSQRARRSLHPPGSGTPSPNLPRSAFAYPPRTPSPGAAAATSAAGPSPSAGAPLPSAAAPHSGVHHRPPRLLGVPSPAAARASASAAGGLSPRSAGAVPRSAFLRSGAIF